MAGADDGVAIIGRGAELEVARRMLVAAQAGTGGLMMLTGEAGIGKSCLLAEAVRRGRARGMTVLLGRSVAGSGPFRPVAQALVSAVSPAVAEHPRLAPYRPVLGRLLPGWPAVPQADSALVDPVVLLGEAVRELLGVIAEPSGVLLGLDDLHWADPDSLALLGYLAGRIGESPVVVIGTARDDEKTPPGLVQLHGYPSVTVLALSRLSSDEVATLARQRSDRLTQTAVETVISAADGLPLLVEELVDALHSDESDPGVPQTVAELTQRRMEALPCPARQVLETAAVLGSTIEWQLLRAATGRSDGEVAGALRAAVDASLLVRDANVEGSLRWRHALTREAVLAQLLPPERAAIARVAAASLDTGVEDSPTRAGERTRLLAELYGQCGREAEAAQLLLTLARAAVDAGALRTAESTLRRAQDFAPDHDDVGVELVRVLALAGRIEEATVLGRRIRSAVHGERLMQLCLHLARAAVAAEQWSEAHRFLAPVVESGDPRVAAVRAHVALGEHDPSRAVALARTAAAAADAGGRPEAVCEAMEIVGKALRRTNPEASEAALIEAERCAERHGLTVWHIRALYELGVNDIYRSGRRDRLQEARRRAQEAGMLATVATLDLNIGARTAVCEGHVAMFPFVERAMTQADRLGLAPLGASARFFAAISRLFGDDRDQVAPLLAEARALAPESMDTSAHYADVEGMAAWVDGDLAEAVAIFDRNSARRHRNPGQIGSPLWGVRALLRVVLDPTDVDALEDLLITEASSQVCNEGARHYAEALTAAHAGDHARADQLISAGDQVLAGHRAWRHMLRLELARPAVRLGVGSPETWVRAAYADFAGTGELCLQRRCRDLMRELGVPVPRSRPGAADVPSELKELGVTTREWQVLELVRQGLTNPGIADLLFLSPRTVETHVANLLAKTGLSRRTQLKALGSVRPPR